MGTARQRTIKLSENIRPISDFAVIFTIVASKVRDPTSDATL
jgi:hypothetical protein